MTEKQNKSLTDSLLAFRLAHIPVELSAKAHWAGEKFSAPEEGLLTEEERGRFRMRLAECPVTVMSGIQKTDGGEVWDMARLFDHIRDPRHKGVPKKNRKVVYTSADGIRPVGAAAYDAWAGFQIIDMDIKDPAVAREIKPLLFGLLQRFHWFAGVALSSSGNGLHVYTRIQVPEGLTRDRRRILYLANYRHKYSFVYLACLQCGETRGWDKEMVQKWLDMAMFKPQQGAFIPCDPDMMVNTGFFRDFIYVNIDGAADMGHPDVDWVAHPDLKHIFRRWEWFEEDRTETGRLDVAANGGDLPEATTGMRVHYKHFERWRLANTLVRLYGQEDAYRLLRSICADTVPDKELLADCVTAARHDKDIDLWAVKRLNQYHGFHIKVEVQGKEADLEALTRKVEVIEDPTELVRAEERIDIMIGADEYLTSAKGRIMSSLGKITLIEAGAGMGKTEMVKSILGDGKKVLLVLPFTSTIKAKIESEKGWGFSYGNIRPDLSAGCIAMTVDKFSQLSPLELQMRGFDYVFIDESHLLFQSAYRPVMPKVIELVRQSEIPVVLMTGTPIAELIFFSGVRHIRIRKDDHRRKSFTLRVCRTTRDMENHIARDIARDIAAGRSVLYPTNAGTAWVNAMAAKIGFLLKEQHRRQGFKFAYYKKANTGDDFMEDVDRRKTMRGLDVLFCSNYLSVGVDIEDSVDTAVYVNQAFMPQELEQFANRLRRKDLDIKMYCAQEDADGTPRDIFAVRPINLELSGDEKRDIESILTICNSMLDRSPEEYKYNAFVGSLLGQNKFVQYSQVEGRYYLNETAYKTHYFEERYRAYTEQLPVVIRGMVSYGYSYECEYKGEYVAEAALSGEVLQEVAAAARADQQTAKSKDIEQILLWVSEETLPVMREWKEGLYRIQKGPGPEADKEARVITCPNVEAWEVAVPLVIGMSRLFEPDRIREIFESCRRRNDIYNIAEARRVKTLATLMWHNRQNRLDLPVKSFMEAVYEWIDASPEGRRQKGEAEEFIAQKSLEYARQESRGHVIIDRSPITMKTIQNILTGIFKCVANVGRPSGGICAVSAHEMPWSQRPQSEAERVDAIAAVGPMFDELVPEGE